MLSSFLSENTRYLGEARTFSLSKKGSSFSSFSSYIMMLLILFTKTGSIDILNLGVLDSPNNLGNTTSSFFRWFIVEW